MGNLFQVSNQTTLGETEAEIIERHRTRSSRHIVKHEESARLICCCSAEPHHAARPGGPRLRRSLLTLISLSSKEALNQLSMHQAWGWISGFFPEAHRCPVDMLFIETQPAHLQKGAP